MAASALAQRTLELIRVPSPTGQEQALAERIHSWARALAPVLRVSQSMVVGDLSDARPPVLLVGHLDTVPPHPVDNPPRLEGDRIFGLGASDMKGGLAVMMALFEELPRASLAVNLLLLLYEREEGPFADSGLPPLLQQVPELSRTALAIALEPTDGTVQLGCAGSLNAAVTFSGVAAHSARPWQGENAIHAAGSLLMDLSRRGFPEVSIGGHTWREVMSATTAQGGRARNVIPDRFELNLNYRFAPNKSVEDARRDLESFVGRRATVHVVDAAPSGRVCADNPLVRTLVALTGRPAQPKQAWTDVARFTALGIDAVNYGPGETGEAHQSTESASQAALTTCYLVLHDLLSQPPRV